MEDSQAPFDAVMVAANLNLPQIDWRDEMLCKGIDVNIFYPESAKDIVGIEMAKRICRVCIVREDCLAYELDKRQQDENISGGLTANERRELIPYRRAAREAKVAGEALAALGRTAAQP